jgi:hypothetical protein
LRIRQAVEFRRAASGASLVTRPLPLYYSTLNLTRALLLTYTGIMGERRHGLGYVSNPAIARAGARVGSDGTFVSFMKSLDVDVAKIIGQTFSLRDVLAQIPEMRLDFPLLHEGVSSVIGVSVRAFIRGDLKLDFARSDVTDEELRTDWKKLFPRLADQCEIVDSDRPVLRALEQPSDEEAVVAFCKKNLWHDLRRRDDAWWYALREDQVAFPLPRLAPYILGLFILSNAVRYEPELLDAVSREPTDIGFAIGSFLDAAERFFPQLVVELLSGEPVFFGS